MKRHVLDLASVNVETFEVADRSNAAMLVTIVAAPATAMTESEACGCCRNPAEA